MDLERIQEALRRQQLDGWLFFDHHDRDPLAYRVLGLRSNRHVTRRWYYFIPAHGEPRKLVHRIEPAMLDALPGSKALYSSWQEQHQELAGLLGGARRVAMQYSPECAIVYVAMVDAGTVELVRRLGTEVVSSAELIQEFEACLDSTQFETHLEAGRRVDQIREEAFDLIRARRAAGIDELTVRDFFRTRFTELGLVTDSGPIIAVNAHAGNPHYSPNSATNVPIGEGDLVLIDTWAKLNDPAAIYYDVTWTGFCGSPREEILSAFDVVKSARDAGVTIVQSAVSEGRDIRGFEVDDAVRAVIRSAGRAEYFVHRTGHSIGTETHGTGANMDNLETHDDRKILPGALFSIEPGLYYLDFGIRLELNVFVDKTSAAPTGPVQTELVKL